METPPTRSVFLAIDGAAVFDGRVASSAVPLVIEAVIRNLPVYRKLDSNGERSNFDIGSENGDRTTGDPQQSENGDRTTGDPQHVTLRDYLRNKDSMVVEDAADVLELPLLCTSVQAPVIEAARRDPHREWRTAELAKATGRTLSSVSSMMPLLVGYGFFERVKNHRRFRLTPAGRTAPLLRTAKPLAISHGRVV